MFVTEWNSSALVKAATRTGKKKNSLTPMTFSLLHATDFADRLLYNIVPPLKAGMIVLARSLRLHGVRPRRARSYAHLKDANCGVQIGAFLAESDTSSAAYTRPTDGVTRKFTPRN